MFALQGLERLIGRADRRHSRAAAFEHRGDPGAERLVVVDHEDTDTAQIRVIVPGVGLHRCRLSGLGGLETQRDIVVKLVADGETSLGFHVRSSGSAFPLKQAHHRQGFDVCSQLTIETDAGSDQGHIVVFTEPTSRMTFRGAETRVSRRGGPGVFGVRDAAGRVARTEESGVNAPGGYDVGAGRSSIQSR